jgi:hypothetical protein
MKDQEITFLLPTCLLSSQIYFKRLTAKIFKISFLKVDKNLHLQTFTPF